MKSLEKMGIQSPKIPKPLKALKVAALVNQDQVAEGLLAGGNFAGTQAGGLVFEQVISRGANFQSTVFERLRMLDCRLERCECSAARWEQARLRRVEFIGCRLLGASLSEATCEDVLFKDCQIEGAVLSLSSFKMVRFEQCNLKAAAFEGADLSGVVFRDCDLSHAVLRGAKLKGADLREAILDGMQAGVQELQGALINPRQAVQVVSLLGVIVKEPGDDGDMSPETKSKP